MQTPNAPSKNNFKNIELRTNCPPVLRLDEAAQMMTISRRTMMDLIQTKQITGKKIGRRRVILRDELEAFMGCKLV